jgi:SAM-dependent methyltransferase
MPATLRYLAQRELAEERDGAYELTERGRAIVKDKGYLVWLQGGYGHVLAGLGDFISGKRGYGTDVERAGRWVAEGSALIGRDDVAPHATDVLGGIDFHRVVDLGCGNARFLIGAAQRFGVTGVGVDLSPEACEDAAQMIENAGLTEKVVVRCGDAGELDAIPELAEADLVVAHFLLHEIFEHGRAALVAYLRKLGALMPKGAHMLVAEVQPASGAHDERWRPEFTLLHAIMRQELLDADGWHEAFGAAGWSRREVRELGLPGAILLLYANEEGA